MLVTASTRLLLFVLLFAGRGLSLRPQCGREVQGRSFRIVAPSMLDRMHVGTLVSYPSTYHDSFMDAQRPDDLIAILRSSLLSLCGSSTERLPNFAFEWHLAWIIDLLDRLGQKPEYLSVQESPTWLEARDAIDRAIQGKVARRLESSRPGEFRGPEGNSQVDCDVILAGALRSP